MLTVMMMASPSTLPILCVSWGDLPCCGSASVLEPVLASHIARPSPPLLLATALLMSRSEFWVEGVWLFLHASPCTCCTHHVLSLSSLFPSHAYPSSFFFITVCLPVAWPAVSDVSDGVYAPSCADCFRWNPRQLASLLFHFTASSGPFLCTLDWAVVSCLDCGCHGFRGSPDLC